MQNGGLGSNFSFRNSISGHGAEILAVLRQISTCIQAKSPMPLWCFTVQCSAAQFRHQTTQFILETPGSNASIEVFTAAHRPAWSIWFLETNLFFSLPLVKNAECSREAERCRTAEGGYQRPLGTKRRHLRPEIQLQTTNSTELYLLYNITGLTKNWFCYDAHFKHQQAKRWIWNGFVGVSQEVLNL